ncbi:MAG: SGNH/GDSL hydrolase family protein [bacterium]
MKDAGTGTLLENGQVALFQGDSITDCGRDRAVADGLGGGYVALAAAWFAAAHPERKVAFRNRGVSGDRVKDLRARWDRDCLALKPDWLTVFVGINDVWRRYDADEPTSAADYEAGYREILGKSRAAGSRLILMEPFVVPYPADREMWREDLDPKIEVVRQLANEFGAILVQLDGLFAEACAFRPAQEWAGDGVHPTAAGHALIARAWLAAVGGL